MALDGYLARHSDRVNDFLCIQTGNITLPGGGWWSQASTVYGRALSFAHRAFGCGSSIHDFKQEAMGARSFRDCANTAAVTRRSRYRPMPLTPFQAGVLDVIAAKRSEESY